MVGSEYIGKTVRGGGGGGGGGGRLFSPQFFSS